MKKKRILFLSPYPYGKAPSQRLKFEQYYSYFEKNGFEQETSSFIDDQFWKVIYQPGFLFGKIAGTLRGYLRRIKDLFRLRQFDIVYIHLWVTPLGPPFFEWLVSKMAKKIVYDIDDMIYLNCSPFLEKFVLQYNSNVTTILASYDTQKTEPKQHSKNEITTIGWTGTHSTMKYLSIVEEALKMLSQQRTIEFLVICNAAYENKNFKVRNISWSAEKETADLKQIDIGLYPLEKEEWVLGKSGNKALAYMNVGVPCVATDFGTNSLVIKNTEDGFLVDNTNEAWFEALLYLTDHPEERTRIGQNAQKAVEQKFSVNANKDKYLNVLIALSSRTK
jgi:L-malate glycosyltransferase